MSRELKPLRDVLSRAVAAARLHPATVARALGVSTRTWHRLLAGQQVLKVRHLLGLAKLLGVPPEDLLELGLPEAGRTATSRLSDWLEARPRFHTTPPAEEWQARIQEAVRRELAAQTNGKDSPAGQRSPARESAPRSPVGRKSPR